MIARVILITRECSHLSLAPVRILYPEMSNAIFALLRPEHHSNLIEEALSFAVKRGTGDNRR